MLVIQVGDIAPIHVIQDLLAFLTAILGYKFDDTHVGFRKTLGILA
jgi:hypothetical protein